MCRHSQSQSVPLLLLLLLPRTTCRSDGSSMPPAARGTGPRKPQWKYQVLHSTLLACQQRPAVASRCTVAKCVNGAPLDRIGSCHIRYVASQCDKWQAALHGHLSGWRWRHLIGLPIAQLIFKRQEDHLLPALPSCNDRERSVHKQLLHTG